MDPTELTPEMVRTEVARIDAAKGDDEGAHGMEDDLYALILRMIATDRIADAKACAQEALKTKLIDFARWCA